MPRYFVPLVYVDINPKKNAERPTIEMTTRTATCPVYAVALYKARWGLQAKVTSRPILAGLNPYFEIICKEGMEPAEQEIARLKRAFNSKQRNVFGEVYTEHQFAGEFERLCKDRNPWLEQSDKAKRAAEELGAQKAAKTLIEQATQIEVNRAAKRERDEQIENPTLAADAHAEAELALGDGAEDDADEKADDEFAEAPAPVEPAIPRRRARSPKTEPASA